MDKKMEILKVLKGSGGRPVSGEDLAKKLNISRAMVWKYIKGLESEGYFIGSYPGSGYIFQSTPDLLYPSEIMQDLDTDLIGRDIRYFDELESTNDMAKKIASEVEDGTVVIAESQKMGRGRKGDMWESPRGGICLSLVLKPHIIPSHASRITLLAGVSVAKAIRSMGINATIKWPNDILVNGRKICGILTEMEAETDEVSFIVLGIGINANVSSEIFSPEIQNIATSLSMEAGKVIDRINFVKSFLETFEQDYIRFKTRPFEEILNDWIGLSDTIGREVKIISPTKMISGIAKGISINGSLLVRQNDGKVEEIIAGRCVYP